MSETLSNHQLSSFTTPAASAALASSVVRGNFNTVATAYNAHDADSGVHFQSSTAASRPAFGTAGRKWFDSDTYRIYYDTGSAWTEAKYLNLTGAQAATGTITFVTPTTSLASINLPHGVAPSSPSNGDVWTTTAGVYVRVNGATVGPLIAASGTTFTGNVAFSGAQISAARYDAGDSSTAITLDFNNGNVQKTRLTGNATLTFSNPVTGGMYTVELLQDGTGSRTVTWPATVKWDNGTTPTLTTTASRKDVFVFLWNGTSYIGGTFALNVTDTN